MYHVNLRRIYYHDNHPQKSPVKFQWFLCYMVSVATIMGGAEPRVGLFCLLTGCMMRQGPLISYQVLAIRHSCKLLTSFYRHQNDLSRTRTDVPEDMVGNV